MTDIVPFGKYKGKPVEVMREDRQYVDWLMAQDWFRQRYSGLFTVIVNNFGEPSETPEHNALQVLFLDQGFRDRFFDHLASPGKRERMSADFSEKGNYRLLPVRALFEHLGADVSLMLEGLSESFMTMRIEIKPNVSDDYPAILRQMKANHCRVLFLENYTGAGATEREFFEVFKSSGMDVVFRRDLA